VNRYLVAFFSLAVVCLLPASATSQVGEAHWKAWNNHERGSVRTSTRTVRRAYVKRRVTYRPKAKRVQVAKYTPSVVKPIQEGEGVLPTPFGVATKVVGSLAGVPSIIQSFLAAVQSQCGSVKVISGHRPGARVAGSGIVSCHATGQAADYTISSPACALRVAAGYQHLGHSNDYGRVAHFHVSSCAREAGMRFAHGGGSRYARARSTRTRVARVYKRTRYAQLRLPSRARATAGSFSGSW
jgi:hypothetical protein